MSSSAAVALVAGPAKMNTDPFTLPANPGLDTDPGEDIRATCIWGSGSGPDCRDLLLNNRTAADLTPMTFGSESGRLGRDSWVIPMLVFSSVNVAVMVCFEAYVVYRASRNTPSRRHLFLGQMLLFGLLVGSLMGFAFAAQPSELSCAVVRMGTGSAYALIYSALLVKLVFLVSLNTGVYLPATYQALLYLFCVLVQLAIGVQWLSSTSASGLSLCAFTTSDHLLSLIYVAFLIVFVTSLAVKSRHYRDNYREAKYIGGLMAVSVPVWMAWVLAAIVLDESFHAPCVGFGLLSCCAITFAIMFVPKSRQLSAIGKEGIYIEDHDDRFSLHSDPYAPSFYHFRPHKTMMAPPPPASPFKESRDEGSFYARAGNSYTGFHRPLRVVPPSATATPAHSHSHSQQHHHTPPPLLHPHHLLRATPPPLLHPHPGHVAAPPPPYSSRGGAYFPSHFFPEKLHQYWQYYYPPAAGFSRPDLESLNIYTSLHENERTKSINPNVYFYKSNYPHPGFIY